MRSRRWQRKQPGSSQIVYGAEEGAEGENERRRSIQVQLNLPHPNQYACLASVASSLVSDTRSLNGAGYRAAFTDPQHQLQPLCLGKSRLYFSRRRQHHKPNVFGYQRDFRPVSRFLYCRLLTVIKCLCALTHAWNRAAHHFQLHATCCCSLLSQTNVIWCFLTNTNEQFGAAGARCWFYCWHGHISATSKSHWATSLFPRQKLQVLFVNISECSGYSVLICDNTSKLYAFNCFLKAAV